MALIERDSLEFKTDTGMLVVQLAGLLICASKIFSIAKSDDLTIVGSKVRYPRFLIS